jgi:hypothetical protein
VELASVRAQAAQVETVAYFSCFRALETHKEAAEQREIVAALREHLRCGERRVTVGRFASRP